MKQSVLVGADEDVKSFAKNHATMLQKVLDIIAFQLHQEYNQIEEGLLEDPSKTENWALAQSHGRGQQKVLRKTIKLLNENYFKHDPRKPVL